MRILKVIWLWMRIMHPFPFTTLMVGWLLRDTAKYEYWWFVNWCFVFIVTLFLISHHVELYMFRLQITWTSRACWTLHVRLLQTWSKERHQKKSARPSILRMTSLLKKRKRFVGRTNGLLSDKLVVFLVLKNWVQCDVLFINYCRILSLC